MQQHEEAARLLRGNPAHVSGGACAVGPSAAAATTGGVISEEDVYGRCTNMRLTSFSETTVAAAAVAGRDPRIIDLAQCTSANAAAAAATNMSSSAAAMLQNGGQMMANSHHHLPPSAAVYPSVANNFNTLPVHLSGGGGGGLGNPMSVHNSQQHAASLHHPHHNTLPARVGESPPRTLLPHHQQAAAAAAAATGRHFKPFDHRRMNPMAEIQENPYELQVQYAHTVHCTYSVLFVVQAQRKSKVVFP